MLLSYEVSDGQNRPDSRIDRIHEIVRTPLICAAEDGLSQSSLAKKKNRNLVR